MDVCSAMPPPEKGAVGPAKELPGRPVAQSAVGVLAGLLGPLAREGVSAFAVSTFDTDYLLVREGDLGRAAGALEGAGHRVEGPEPCF